MAADPGEASFRSPRQVVSDEIEELQRLVVGGFKNSRERSLVLTKLDEALLWLTKCDPETPVKITDTSTQN